MESQNYYRVQATWLQLTNPSKRSHLSGGLCRNISISEKNYEKNNDQTGHFVINDINKSLSMFTCCKVIHYEWENCLLFIRKNILT